MSDQWSFAMTGRHCKDYIAIWENGFFEGRRKQETQGGRWDKIFQDDNVCLCWGSGFAVTLVLYGR